MGLLRLRRYLPWLAIPGLLYLLTGLWQIRPEERAVVRRFGAIVAHPGPGLWMGLPWGMDRLERVRVNTAQQLRIGYKPEEPEDPTPLPRGQMLTADQNLVNLQVVIDYAVGQSDADLDAYVLHRTDVENVLTRQVESLAAQWLAARPIDTILLTANADLPAWITDQLTHSSAIAHLGIRLQRVSLGHLAPPEEVRPAFEAVNSAQTGIRTREHQASEQANRRLRQADTYRYRLLQQAQAFRDEQLRLAAADADAFNERLRQLRRLQHAQSQPDILTLIWWQETGQLLMRLKERGRVDLLDARLGPDGLDLTHLLSPPK